MTQNLTPKIRDEQGHFLPGHNAPGPGSPPIHLGPETIEIAADQYFLDVRRNAIALKTNELIDDTCTDDHRPTMTGLALALGFASRQSFLDYSRRDPAFSDAIMRARSRVERAWEDRLYDASAAGAIFALKNNAGWRDEKHLSVDSTVREIRIIAPQGIQERIGRVIEGE